MVYAGKFISDDVAGLLLVFISLLSTSIIPIICGRVQFAENLYICVN